MGRRKRPFFRVVVIDSRSQRDGRAIEKLGHYNPMTDPAEININEDRALYWLQIGAKPSDTAKSLLSKVGIWERFKNPPKVAPEIEDSDEAEVIEETVEAIEGTEVVEVEDSAETAEETSEE